MKLPHILLILGVSGLAVSVYALQGLRSENAADPQTTYYSNGQIQSQTNYVDGHREGTSLRFYSDGKPMAEGRYSAGKMDGWWTFWQPDGTVDKDRSGTYRDGEKQIARPVE